MSIPMKGAGVSRKLFGTDVTVSFEPAENGWTTARIPAVPSVITAGATRDEARELAIDALMETLAVEPAARSGVVHERVHLDVLTVRTADRDLGHER
jgi:predicted RNase H-like HicB family nuclease